MSRAGFTLVELVVVISIIAILASSGWWIIGAVMAQQMKQRTHGTVLLVAAAIASYRQSSIAVPSADRLTLAVRQLWDFRNDGLIDGDPEREARFTAADRDAARRAGYRGIAAMAGLALSAPHLDRDGRVLDAWLRPLRVARGAEAYGASGWGVWSAGPDGLDNTDDDIRSWRDSRAP